MGGFPQREDAPVAEDAPVIPITGTAIFGGVDVRDSRPHGAPRLPGPRS